MDIVSHGLWGAIAFGRKNKKAFYAALFFGITPDLFSFGLYTSSQIIGIIPSPEWQGAPPDSSAVPAYVHTLYDLTHSLITFAVVFGLVWLIRRKPFLPMLAWPLHILVDIPTHTTRFFPTPFLWPFSEYRFDGISWASPYVFFPNLAALLIVYAVFYWKGRKR